MFSSSAMGKYSSKNIKAKISETQNKSVVSRPSLLAMAPAPAPSKCELKLSSFLGPLGPTPPPGQGAPNVPSAVCVLSDHPFVSLLGDLQLHSCQELMNPSRPT